MSTTPHTSIATNLTEYASSTAGNLSIRTPTYYITLPFMLLFFVAAVENVVGCVFMVKSKKNNDAISTALVGLALGGIVFSVCGFVNVCIYLYIGLKSPDDVPFMLCSITLYCWFLSMLISTEQMFIISVIRVVSILKIQKMSTVAGGFTRKKAIIMAVVMWSLSYLCCMITMAIDYAKSSSQAPYCRFRSSLGMFKTTTTYIIVVYIFSYTACVLIYGVSIGILTRVHYKRRQVDNIEEPKRILSASECNSEIATISDTGLSKIVIQDSKLSRVKIAWDTINEKASRCQMRLKQRFEQLSRNQNSTAVTESIASTSNCEQPYCSRSLYRKRPPGKRPSVLVATFIIGVLIVVHSLFSVPWIVQMIFVMADPEAINPLLQALFFAVVTFMVNPFIYSMSLPSVRERVIKCVKCGKT